jgi:hypothetical protein
MIRLRWTTWRRDVLIGGLVSLLTASLLVPIAWASVRDEREQAEAARQQAEAAKRLADEKAAEAAQPRELDLHKLFDQAVTLAGFADNAQGEAMEVSSAAVSPEVPKGAHLLLDKKAVAYAVGDIVVVRVEGKNYLGRVVAVEKKAGRLTLGRNGEANRQVSIRDVVGRGVLNTR